MKGETKMIDEKAKEQALFWHQLKLLLSSHLSLVPALETVEKSIADEELKQAIEKVKSEIERGLAMADAMRFCSNVFSEIAVTLVSIGEETATLEVQVGQIAEGCENGTIPVGGAKSVEEARAELATSEEVEPHKSPKVREYVNAMITDAVSQKASDIHIEPFDRKITVRYRVDGVLHEIDGPPEDIQWAIIDRIKTMADMDIAQKRFPQDGKISLKIALDNREFDLRVSCVPAQYNSEAVTIRILDRQTPLSISLSDLGLSPPDLELFESSIRQPHGIIIVSGPTGSGKTTTLYATLGLLRSTELKLLSIEEPVEYNCPGVTQIDVNPGLGLTFPVGIRHILRQDPDIVMVGEARDYETAEMIIHTALTGHLVLTTLHMNDAPSVIVRLIDMGVEPYLIGSSLILASSQRLVRKLCQNCKNEPIDPPETTLELLAKDKVDISDKSKLTAFKPVGCPECRQTGYKGRTGVFELLPVSDEIREMIVRGITSEQIRRVALQKGMRSMREDGMQKVANGITSIDEVLRVTPDYMR